MNFALFETAVVKGLQEKLGEDYRILSNQVKKNNGILLTGIIVEEKNKIGKESALTKLWNLCTGFFLKPRSKNPWICQIFWNMKRQKIRLLLK